MSEGAHERVALVAMYPRNEFQGTLFHNYGVHRIEAALRSGGAGGAGDVRVFELPSADEGPPDLDGLVAALEAYDPDLVGFSAYLWSFPTLVEVARRLRARGGRRRTVVLGGPAAHPKMFSLEPFADAPGAIDALVLRDGEEAILEIAAAPLGDGAALRRIPGLALPSAGRSLPLQGGSGWAETAPRRRAHGLDDVASPYQRGLMPKGGIGYLQTYRGCPLSCAYCEWGAQEDPRDVLSAPYLVRELAGLGEAGVEGALLVDAALNLNPQAFENLAAAEAQVRLFERRVFLCELYPVLLTAAHLRFLGGMENAHCQMGLQSFDPEVLRALDRIFDEQRFDQALGAVSSVASVTVEIIFGLPGDNVESFRRTFDRLRKLPCRVRVYHCVVLPSALMSRAPEHFAPRFDPWSLKMISCLGWGADDLAREQARLTEMAIREEGRAGTFWWDFPSPAERARRAPRARPQPTAAGSARR